MHIPQKFPQYIGERALFIITGSEEAKLYIAADGEINSVDAFRVRPAAYDASEKSVYPLNDSDKQVHLNDFLTTLTAEIQAHIGDEPIDHVYLFTPAHLHNDVHGALPPNLVTVLRKTIEGNVLDASAIELLEKLHTL